MSVPIILASGSEIRRRLLVNAGVAAEVVVPRVDEDSVKDALVADGALPRDVADALAGLKAQRVAEKRPDSLVIGCDQVLDLDRRLLSKANSPEEARTQLAALNGRRHSLHSAVVVYQDARPVWRHVGFVGANVTIPHKEAVLALADVVSDRAALIGAANTLIFRQDGKIHADNTDGYGFLENIRSGAPWWVPEPGPAAVYWGGRRGAGGRRLVDRGRRSRNPAGQPHAQPRGCPAVRIRDEDRRVDWVQAGNMLDGARLVVNTTSLGMVGKADFRVPLDALAPRGRGDRPRLCPAAHDVPAAGGRTGLQHGRWAGDAAAPGGAGVRALVRPCGPKSTTICARGSGA
jgi:predicted house-cleaning NTP pyrophosphatase (Maf/HAM1 superfamily)